LRDSMSEATTRSRWEGQPNPAGDPCNGNGTTAELRLAVENLHASSEQSFACIQLIVSRGDSLAGELSATRESLL
jgi:hypothetical protein